MFNRGLYANSRPDGFGVLEIVAGPSEDAQRAARLFVPLKRTELRGQVFGPLAALQLRQVFAYAREDCPHAIEAVYRFPLPGDAAVTGVTVRFGEVEIIASLKPREQAEAAYEQAKSENRQAALVTRESPDVFTLAVSGLQPDQEVVIDTAYLQLARTTGTGWSLRIPLTTAPRYVRSDERTSRHAAGQPLSLLRDPGHRFSLDLRILGAASVESRTHPLQVEMGAAGVHVRLQDDEVIPDRDCVLTWHPLQRAAQTGLQIYADDDTTARWVHFLAQVTPPLQAQDNMPAPAREVLLLVDHSGSMEGPKWAAADWAVKRFLSELTEADTFNLGLFHDSTHWFARAPRPATAATLREAEGFLDRSRDSGGTELGVALEQALRQPRSEGDYARHVIVITDAQVSDAGRILRLADQEARQRGRRRISVLCIDAAPNAYLASSLAERGGGVARFLTSNAQEEDISTALDEILLDWAQPVLADLRLEIDREQVAAAGRLVTEGSRTGWSAIDLGDLPVARSMWVAGRAWRGEALSLGFRLLTRSGVEVASTRVGLGTVGGRNPALRPLFGAPRVLALEHLAAAVYPPEELAEELRRLGYDPARILAGLERRGIVYAENQRLQVRDALSDLVRQEALEYGLASSETSFVAMRRERGQAVQVAVAVANALPAGWSEDFQTPALASFPRARSTRMMAKAVSDGARLDMRFLAHSESAGGAAPGRPREVFAGVPDTTQREFVLFDTQRPQDAGVLAGLGSLSSLEIAFPEGAPASLDGGLVLLLFVDDLTQPIARVRLVDLMRLGGRRPLNVALPPGARLLLVLDDENRVWQTAAPRLVVALG